MNLVLIAPPAAGKGTLASMLNEKYGLINISAGDLLRSVNPETEIGKQIRKIQSEGKLVDNKIICSLIKTRLSESDIQKGFILDGFPREIEQVYLLEDICKELNLKIDAAVYLNVSFETALKRTLGRQLCPECKATYNKLTGFKLPLIEDTCDKCGTKLISRNDDNENSLKARFELFNDITYKVVEHYKNKNMLIELDSDKQAIDTFNDFIKSMEQLND